MTHFGLGQLLTRTWRRIFAKHSDSSSKLCGGETPARPPAVQASLEALTLLDAREQAQYLALSDFIAASPSQFLYELVPFKETLTARLPIQDAFEVFSALLKLPPSATVEYRLVKSLTEVAAREAIIYRETAPRGIAFSAQPPRVVGVGDHRPLECMTRSLSFACLADARVHGRSAFIDFHGAALFDFQGQELDHVDERFTLDLPVLRASKETLWLSSSTADAMEVDEAFHLLGPNTPQFGHWIWEYMPKYIAAAMSAAISKVPVLIDRHMPRAHRQFLELVAGADTEIIEIPYSTHVRVRRLWCASGLFYVPLYPRTVDPRWLTYRTAPPDRFAAVIREMWRRMEPALPPRDGPERLFLARKPHQLRKLVNHAAIEQCAEKCGFVVAYPQDLDFADQVRLISSARYIVGPAGSALLLSFFARPGTKMCILSSQHILRSTSYTCLLEELGIDVTVLTGPVLQEHEYAHFADYSVPENTFRAFLEDWLS